MLKCSFQLGCFPSQYRWQLKDYRDPLGQEFSASCWPLGPWDRKVHPNTSRPYNLEPEKTTRNSQWMESGETPNFFHVKIFGMAFLYVFIHPPCEETMPHLLVGAE